MTRKEAIEEFGMYVTYNTAPFIAYKDSKSAATLLGELANWTGWAVNVKQMLGEPKNEREDRKSLGLESAILEHFFCSEKEDFFHHRHNDFRELIKKDIVDRLISLHKPTRLQKAFNLEKTEAELREFYEYHPTVSQFLKALKINIDFLPESISLDRSSLDIGDSIYCVFDGEDPRKSTLPVYKALITEKEINFCAQAKEWQLNFRARSGQDGNYLSFVYGDVDGFKEADFHVAETSIYRLNNINIFINAEGAKNYQSDVWSRIESNRQKYLRSRGPKVT